MEVLLDNINSPLDLRKIPKEQLPILAKELREFILDTLSVKPGHLGASLGVVELSIALHYFYNTPDDQLIWDVGHQCYPHKILTGRKSEFDSLRQLNGISGFPSVSESKFDAFGTGHSSTSISAITGMAIADHLQGKSNRHIAVIGDASIASGMAFEGLNHLGSTDLDVTIILNDNSIGIDPSVGALKSHFFDLENGLNHSIFEELGFYYKGVVDGHDFNAVFQSLEELESIPKPKILHIKTVKGKGYANAEADQVKWHSPGLFNKETGEISLSSNSKISYQTVFGNTLTELMRHNERIVAITPAMLTGSNLIQTQKEFPHRVLDIGIAEQHAVTLAAGMAKQGVIPYVAIYSTFLQRAYDQVIHDVALQNFPVVFCLDRAGLVGTDGATHHGFFDISFLRAIPNMMVSAPMDEKDFQNLLYSAQFTKNPMSIRFPKGNTEVESLEMNFNPIEIGKAEELKSGIEIAILSFGTIGNRIQKILKEWDSDKFGHYKFLFVKPLDKEMLSQIFQQYHTLITFEDGVLKGGFGDAILEFAQESNFQGKIICKGYPDEFIEHGTVEELEIKIGLDEKSIRLMFEKFL
jgi:1-deoxy-D-xylulose-5-phosphate synthase